MLGFIILRHVNSIETNKLWIESLTCIRKFYSNPVMIIDDNSDYMFVSQNIDLTNVTVVQSEFPKRGELLPYYYFHKLKPFDTTVIIHDSVFIQKHIDFKTDNVNFLWCFYLGGENIISERQKISCLKNSEELLNFYNDGKWLGCFGGMSVITHEFLSMLVEKYDMFQLLDVILCREDRMCFERIFAVICISNAATPPSLFGVIHDYIKWGYTFGEYIHSKPIIKTINVKRNIRPLIKVWSGR
jgi:hypothetical protein